MKRRVARSRALRSAGRLRAALPPRLRPRRLDRRRARQLPHQSRSRHRPRRGVAEARTSCVQLAAEDRRRPARRPGSGDAVRDAGLADLHRRDSAGRAVSRRPRDDVGGRRVHVPALPRSGVRVRRARARTAISRRSTIVDRYTVAFRLKAPSAAFPINLVDGHRAGGHRRRRPRAGRSAAGRTGSPSSCPTITSRCAASTATSAARRRTPA